VKETKAEKINEVEKKEKVTVFEKKNVNEKRNRRQRFKVKRYFWRKKQQENEVKDNQNEVKKVEEKEKVKEVNEKVEEINFRSSENFESFQKARLPGPTGMWHFRASQQRCWKCGQPGHRQFQCNRDQGKTDIEKRKNSFDSKNRFTEKSKTKTSNFSKKFCLVHGQCGHNSNKCRDVQWALSSNYFFNQFGNHHRLQNFQQRRFFDHRLRPLDHK